MNVILFTKRGGSRHIDLKRPAMLGLLTIAAGLLLGAAFMAGYGYAERALSMDPDARVAQLEQELAAQREAIADARAEAREQVDALAVRLGQMQAHVIRLDALGARLTRMADLEEGEFDFENPPAQGGPESSAASQAVVMPDFVTMLDDLAVQIEDRQRQFGVLENLLINRNLHQQVHPEGRPVNSGWLSSYYGYRTDPFTKKRSWHEGVDFAGREGADVVAVAAGVVTWSGPRYGYGNLVEINHGNGYSTRYAHNERNLVEVGETVKKGQVVALMGSTGRSTAPHTHFEVLRDGRVVDPLKFIQGSN